MSKWCACRALACTLGAAGATLDNVGAKPVTSPRVIGADPGNPCSPGGVAGLNVLGDVATGFRVIVLVVKEQTTVQAGTFCLRPSGGNWPMREVPVPVVLTRSGGLLIGQLLRSERGVLVPSAGGLDLGGSSAVGFRPNPDSFGGLMIGGSSAVIFFPTLSGAGGLDLGGSSAIAFVPNPESAGGLDLGGSSAVGFRPNPDSFGGFMIGGSSAVTA